MTIKIYIRVDGSKVMDGFDKENTNLSEVAVALFRLKQLEHELIAMQFEDEFEVKDVK